MLFELIGNALKFTNKGKILIKIKEYDEHIISIKVYDTGQGMSESMRKNMFQNMSF